MSRLRWIGAAVTAIGLQLFWLGTYELLRLRPFWVALVVLAGPWLMALSAWLAQLPATRRRRAALLAGLAMLGVDQACALLVELHTPLVLTYLEPLRLAAFFPALWIAPRLRGWWRATALVVAGLVGLLAVGYVAGAVHCILSARRDDTRRADAAVVLGFALLRGGRPSPAFVARIRHGVGLYNRGVVRRLILTGGKGPYGPPESVVAAGIVRRMGVPGRAVLREHRSRNTRENMIETAKLVRRNGIRTVLIVTEPYHIGRAMIYAKTVGLRAYASPSSSPIWDHPPAAANRVMQEAFYTVVAVVHAGWRACVGP